MIGVLNSLAINKQPIASRIWTRWQIWETVVDTLEVQTNVGLSDCKALAPVLGWPDGEVQYVGSASISDNDTGCTTEDEILQSVLGPTSPAVIGQTFSIPSGSIGDSTIDMFLNFTPAIERESIFPVTGHRATCSSVEYQSDPDQAPPISQYPSSICKRLPARWSYLDPLGGAPRRLSPR